jgi:hypothetical protein
MTVHAGGFSWPAAQVSQVKSSQHVAHLFGQIGSIVVQPVAGSLNPSKHEEHQFGLVHSSHPADEHSGTHLPSASIM